MRNREFFQHYVLSGNYLVENYSLRSATRGSTSGAARGM